MKKSIWKDVIETIIELKEIAIPAMVGIIGSMLITLVMSYLFSIGHNVLAILFFICSFFIILITIIVIVKRMN